MCTISVIPLDQRGSALRIVCNRDEHRERSRALPPRWHSLRDGKRALWPVDTHAGGTWIGAGEHGLVLCVLNHNPHPPVNVVDLEGLRSRGLLIPDLIGEEDAEGVVGRIRREAFDSYAPFRLLAIEPARRGRDALVAEVRWDRRSVKTAWHGGLPQCFVSSGLGDARVAPRLDLFEAMVVEPGPSSERQDEFHRHSWPDRPEVSVLMSRTEACTVSISTLEVEAGEGARHRLRMGYEAVPRAALPVR